MKKIILPVLFFFIATLFFCCAGNHLVPLSFQDLLHKKHTNSAAASRDLYISDGGNLFRLEDAYVSGDTLYGEAVAAPAGTKTAKKASLVIHTQNTVTAKDTASGEKVPVAIPKRDLRRISLHEAGDDDGAVGIAIGLLVLIILVSVLILFGLIYLLAVASSNATNNAANNSGSNSNSGGSSGNGNGSSSGCYVATMVYGSYEAPEVMVLRRFRDETLSRSKAGRAFIRWYYGWSPGFVKKYNHLAWLHRVIRVLLDQLVKFLSR